VVALLIAVASLASAQSAPEKQQAATSSEDAAEIVVTGERVPRSLRRTPSSVVVFTSDMIETQPGADRLDQFLEQVPNVQFGPSGQGPTIRGQDTTGRMLI